MGVDGRTGPILGAVVTASVVIAALGVAATAATPPVGNPYAWSQFITGCTAVGVGAAIARRRPDHPMGWLLLTAGATAWVSFAGAPGVTWMMIHAPGLETLTRALLHLAVSGWIVCRGVMLTLIPLAFPDGFGAGWWRRLIRWGSIAATTITAVAHSRLFTPEYFAGQQPTGTAALAADVEPWGTKAMLALGVLAIGTMIASAVRTSPAERARSCGFVAAVAALLLPTLNGFYSVVADGSPVELDALEVWTMALLPVVLGIGVVRHQLLGIDVIVRRGALYLTVTIAGAAIYLAAVWVVVTVGPASDVAPPVIAAGAVALTLGLVRDRLQQLASRRFFGSRDDPYAVLARLGALLEASPANEQALQVVTDTICEQLRLPFAAADLTLDDTQIRAARTGAAPDDPTATESFALAHHGISLGQLVVARRSPNEPLTEGERSLIATLARQAGVLAQNVALVEALRRSRVVLLNAREEERRRIRADLHDGLGPTLATVAMGLEASIDRIDGEPELTALLRDLDAELHTAIADLRSLVYNLRPAALDELGLVSAVREHAQMLADRSEGSGRPLEVSIQAPAAIGPLPAAVEVAAYRVALEALTNVARHARASRCEVHIGIGDGLELTVRDNGVGLGPDRQPGIGLRSMRDRVVELGGRFHASSAPGGGTEVSARFPALDLVGP